MDGFRKASYEMMLNVTGLRHLHGRGARGRPQGARPRRARAARRAPAARQKEGGVARPVCTGQGRDSRPVCTGKRGGGETSDAPRGSGKAQARSRSGGRAPPLSAGAHCLGSLQALVFVVDHNGEEETVRLKTKATQDAKTPLVGLRLGAPRPPAIPRGPEPLPKEGGLRLRRAARITLDRSQSPKRCC